MSQNILDNLKKSSTFNNSKKIIHIETLGCRLNQIESESVASFFSSDNFSVVMKSITSKEEINNDVILCIVNTCTVTAKAEQKARRTIRLLAKKFPYSVIVVTGCYAQVNAPEILAIDEKIVVLPGRVKSRLEKIPHIVTEILQEENFKTENSNFENLQDKTLLENSLFKIQQKIKNILTTEICSGDIPKISENPFNLATDTFLQHSRSSIKIQDGCNNRCTYCEICLARGDSISLEVEKVLAQVEKLKNSGQKEIVITTVNIAQYRGALGKVPFDVTEENKKNLFTDLDGKKYVNFAGLLEILLKQTSGINFRFSSLYPQIVDEYFATLVADERVQPHFHLSVQSGSDFILEKMARPYKAQVVKTACSLLKKAKKNPFLACDIIAGFPAESDEDFNATINLLTECDFTFVHAFPFSPRPNTKAFVMKPKVPESVTKTRIQKLLEYSSAHKSEYINRLVGTCRRAIIEQFHTDMLSDESIVARTGFVENSQNLQSENSCAENEIQRKKIIHCVTDNFLHCVVELEENQQVPPPKSEIIVEIVKPLKENILNGAEYEVLAKLV